MEIYNPWTPLIVVIFITTFTLLVCTPSRGKINTVSEITSLYHYIASLYSTMSGKLGEETGEKRKWDSEGEEDEEEPQRRKRANSEVNMGKLNHTHAAPLALFNSLKS